MPRMGMKSSTSASLIASSDSPSNSFPIHRAILGAVRSAEYIEMLDGVKQVAMLVYPSFLSSSRATLVDLKERDTTHRLADAELRSRPRESSTKGSSRSTCGRMLVPSSSPLCTNQISVTPKASQLLTTAPALPSSWGSSKTTMKPACFRAARASILACRLPSPPSSDTASCGMLMSLDTSRGCHLDRWGPFPFLLLGDIMLKPCTAPTGRVEASRPPITFPRRF
mmetsp:Transcript_2340/g.5572  ORF Transcript_2340/g.5572 Transcript_2340/m.5572 type:complete len:225 (-) Transcript_2340:298-972(-)